MKVSYFVLVLIVAHLGCKKGDERPPDTIAMIQDGEWFTDSTSTEYLDSLGNTLQVFHFPAPHLIKWKFMPDGTLQISSNIIPCNDVFTNPVSFSYTIKNGIIYKSRTTAYGIDEESLELKSINKKEMVLRSQTILKLNAYPYPTSRSREVYKLIKGTYPERFKNWPCP